MFMLLSSRARVHLMNVEQRQAAPDPQTKPTDQTASPSVGCYCQHPPSPFIITQPKRLYSPTEGRRLSQPRHRMWKKRLSFLCSSDTMPGVESHLRNASLTLHQMCQHTTLCRSSWYHTVTTKIISTSADCWIRYVFTFAGLYVYNKIIEKLQTDFHETWKVG